MTCILHPYTMMLQSLPPPKVPRPLSPAHLLVGVLQCPPPQRAPPAHEGQVLSSKGQCPKEEEDSAMAPCSVMGQHPGMLQLQEGNGTAPAEGPEAGMQQHIPIELSQPHSLPQQPTKGLQGQE